MSCHPRERGDPGESTTLWIASPVDPRVREDDKDAVNELFLYDVRKPNIMKLLTVSP